VVARTPANGDAMQGIDGERGSYAKLFQGVEDVKELGGGHILGTSEIHYEDWRPRGG